MYPAHRALCLLAAFIGAVTLSAEATAGTAPPAVAPVACGLVSQPAATVLLPYFEVDVESPGGRNTLFSVGTVHAEPTLVHAVVWTNWSQPVLSFDVVLPAEGLRTFDVRALLEGRLPTTSPPPVTSYDGCTSPLTVPAVDGERLTALLTGQPDPEDGLCYAHAVEDGRLATGFVTVDVVRGCSGAQLTTPRDEGYFVDGGAGLGRNDNLLWGEFFLIDPENDYAQGEKLVTLIADATRFGDEIVCVTEPCPPRTFPTFYRNRDNRMPLPRVVQARFLNGGGFSGGTELVVWTEIRLQPAACGTLPEGRVTNVVVSATARDQAGDVLQSVDLSVPQTLFRMGGDLLPTGASFGHLDLQASSVSGGVDPVPPEDLQVWMMPLVSALGRFSVGVHAVPVEDFCNASP